MSILNKITSKWGIINEKLVYQHLENKENEIALAILDNYINRAPGNFKLIKIYASVVEGLIEEDKKNGNHENANHKIRWLNQFYIESSKHVNVKYVPELIKLANKRQIETSTVIRSDKKTLPRGDLDKHLKFLLEEVKHRSKRTTANSSELRNILSNLVETDKNYTIVSDAQKKVDATIRYEELIQNIDTMLTEKNELPDERLQMFFLQHVELLLKEMVFILPQLEAEYYSDFQNKKDWLERETIKYREAANKDKWSKFVNEFEKENNKELKKVKQKKIASMEATPFVESATHLIATISENYINQFAGQVNNEYTLYLDDLHKNCTDWVEFRYDKYQQWALDKIKTVFDRGIEHVGIKIDREKIADIVVANLGEIDQTLLKPTTARLYSECLEYFLGKFKTPKKDLFKNKKSKPRVIELIAIKKKKSLESF